MARWVNWIFIFVFAYTVSALVFWHSSLQKQNRILYQKERELASYLYQSAQDKEQAMNRIDEKFKRKRYQYYGEGGTFLLFILAGAFIVYFSFRKRIQLGTQQSNFMLSISHELKSPLAGIKVGLETLKKRILSEEQKNNILNNSLAETERLNELCSNILLSTQLDGNDYMKNATYFDLIQLIREIVNIYSTRHPHIQWTLNDYSDLKSYHGDKFLWQLIISNLLENIVKYAGESKEVITDIYKNNNLLIIQILDQGKGISESDRKKIFQKFYRVGSEKTRNSKGTGLGLFIVRSAVEQHGGVIQMLPNAPQGNIAEIKIPIDYEQAN